MKEDKQYLRDRKQELYNRLVELNEDANRLRKYAHRYAVQPKRKATIIKLAAVLDDEADKLDECCMDIESILKTGRINPDKELSWV